MNAVSAKEGKRAHEGHVLEMLKPEFGYTNTMSAPRVTKVVVHTGTGKLGKEMHETVSRVLAAITGQRPAPRPARKSIASFGTRAGMIIGFQSTLRGKRMYDFIERLIHVVLPRMRDFRGIPESSFDHAGNLSIGIREHIVFPEVALEDTRIPFGIEVTITTNARSRKEGIALLRALGFPLQPSLT